MTQLVLDGIALPEAIKDTYKAYKDDLGVELQMISGRTVKEVRDSVWRISYSGGYFDPDTKNALLAACEKGKREPIRCGFLRAEEDSENLIYGDFWVKSYKRPKFAWSTTEQVGEVGNVQTVVRPLWVGFAVELRGVRPF